MNPQDLGLKPESWRPHQEETVKEIIDSTSDVIVVDAPTGSGKSVLALATARMSLEKTFIVTKNKSLQVPYLEEAGELAKSITGKNNYNCVLPRYDPEEARGLGVSQYTTVDVAPCAGGYECAWRGRCDYFVEKRMAVKHPISIHNYSYWVPEANYVGEFTNAGYIFADEGHLLDDVLTDFASVVMGPRILAEYDPPRGKSPSLESWVKWGGEVAEKLTTLLPPEGVARSKALKRLALFITLAAIPLDETSRWVLDYDDRGLVIRPLWPVRVKETLLHGKKLVIMSGTILDHEMFAEALSLGDHHYIALPWTFPPESRPVFYRPAAEVTRVNQEKAIPALARVSDHIISTHRGEKGVIHSQSFNLGESVARAMTHDKLLVHSRGVDRTTIVEQFKKSAAGTWLISPSVGHGEDFAFDLARCQIILKIPFLDYGDQLVRLRAKANPAWYYYATAQELVQKIGRVTRDKEDYGETWILDSKWEVYENKYKRFIPSEIWAAVS